MASSISNPPAYHHQHHHDTDPEHLPTPQPSSKPPASQIAPPLPDRPPSLSASPPLPADPTNLTLPRYNELYPPPPGQKKSKINDASIDLAIVLVCGLPPVIISTAGLAVIAQARNDGASSESDALLRNNIITLVMSVIGLVCGLGSWGVSTTRPYNRAQRALSLCVFVGTSLANTIIGSVMLVQSIELARGSG